MPTLSRVGPFPLCGLGQAAQPLWAPALGYTPDAELREPGARLSGRVRTQSAVTVVNEILMKAGRGVTASPQCPQMETNLLGSRRSRKPAKGRLPGPAPSEAVPGGSPAPAPPGWVTHKAQGRPPPSDYFRAGTCPESTDSDFPDLSSPLSDLPLLGHPSRPHFLTHSLLSFLFKNKDSGPNVSAGSWERFSLQRECHEHVGFHGWGLVTGRITHRRAETWGCGGGAPLRLSLWAMAGPAWPCSPVGTEPGATKFPALQTSHSVTWSRTSQRTRHFQGCGGLAGS